MEQAPDQNMNPGSVTPPPAAAPMADAPKNPAAFGSVLGIILIVAILVAGAFYVWNERLGTSEMPENGVRGEVLPDGSMPTVEGAADIEEGENGPVPQ
ncbi:MAG: hypothetical protein QG636_334 [Patescibacteria group bacterium]|nr:hypothetical protein [Patescibacteria group bacterium]